MNGFHLQEYTLLLPLRVNFAFTRNYHSNGNMRVTDPILLKLSFVPLIEHKKSANRLILLPSLESIHYG